MGIADRWRIKGSGAPDPKAALAGPQLLCRLQRQSAVEIPCRRMLQKRRDPLTHPRTQQRADANRAWPPLSSLARRRPAVDRRRPPPRERSPSAHRLRSEEESVWLTLAARSPIARPAPYNTDGHAERRPVRLAAAARGGTRPVCCPPARPSPSSGASSRARGRGVHGCINSCTRYTPTYLVADQRRERERAPPPPPPASPSSAAIPPSPRRCLRRRGRFVLCLRARCQSG